MNVDFLQIIRLSPTSFTISLPQKMLIPPRYAKPQKNKNIKNKTLFTLQHKSKYSFLTQHTTPSLKR